MSIFDERAEHRLQVNIAELGDQLRSPGERRFEAWRALPLAKSIRVCPIPPDLLTQAYPRNPAEDFFVTPRSVRVGDREIVLDDVEEDDGEGIISSIRTSLAEQPLSSASPLHEYLRAGFAFLNRDNGEAAFRCFLNTVRRA